MQGADWLNFKRMQGVSCLFASLIYLAAVLHAWRVLPGSMELKTAVTLGFPAAYFLASLVLPLFVGPIRRWLKRHLMRAFAAGIGQSPVSVLTVLGLLAAAAGLIYFQIHQAAEGGRYPAGVFSAYGAGIGLLFAQQILVRRLEQEPRFRELIRR